ncbi:MAG: hypothetical protein WCN88_00435 [Candidatus Falkowbacteria bacterium]
MGLLYFLPETISTINIIPGYFLGHFPMILIIGLFLSLIVYLCYKLKRKKKIEKDGDFLLTIFFLFWLILTAFWTVANVLDYKRNQVYYHYDLPKKQIARVCNLLTTDDGLCRIFSFIKNIQAIVPPGAIVKIEAIDTEKTFLEYYIYPKYKYTENNLEADYLLYYPEKIIKKNK